MKYTIFLFLSFLLLSGCKSTEKLTPVSQIKPGVSKEGSLANERLISDATAGLEKIIGRSVDDAELLKFVIQQPVGKTGARSWTEMWIVKSPESQTQFLMTFKEVGLSAADFEIKPMNTTAQKSDCPNSVSKFVTGQSNEFVKKCLGEPDNVDNNQDGRFIYFYHREKGVVLTYLFNKNKELTKYSAYQKTK
jgi:outer membrane protein assembly factor BamE (lipoprotein component of BamABCDE complex)